MIIQLPVGMLDSNCYLIYDRDGGQGAIVDPGAERPADVLNHVEEHRLAISHILNTHGHFDHIVSNGKLDLPDAVLAIHRADRNLLMAGGGAPMFGLPFVPSPEPTLMLEDGMVLQVGELEVKVIHTPGHSPGCVCFHVPQDGAVVTGDTLFAGSVGRTDLPGSDPAAMQESLRRLIRLPTETKVYPGHGPASSIGRELQSNPFLRGVR